jgi:sec-independent protein translocase protein TatA
MFDGLFDKPWLIIVIVILFIVMFGSRKLPGAARSLGQSMRILKKEISGLHEDEQDASGAPATADATPAVAQAQLQAPPVAPAAAPAAPDAQAQIAALQTQLNNLQQTVGANGTTATDSKQTR